MTIIKIDKFSGIAPRFSNRLLPNNMAVAAQNAKLLSGELRGLHETSLLHDFNSLLPVTPIQRAYRLPLSVAAPIPISGSDNWISFTDASTDFVRTPVLEDSFERYYWTGDQPNQAGAPKYNTRARINAGNSGGNAPLLLGIPAPNNTLTLVPPAGLNLTRAYLCTFVSAYGEEGAPCLPVTATGTNGTWVLSGLPTTANIPSPYTTSNTNITSVKIYRTVTGTTATEYYYVATVAIGTTSYNDSALDATVALNYTLPSLTWGTPPPTLEGLIVHPGGFLVGFSGRDVWMSQPYQPHAWPVQYIQTCQTEIVGIQVYQQTMVITTTSHPYTADGMSPLGITFQKLDSFDPCVSRRSMATTMNGVYYASPQGIIQAVDGSTTLITEQLFTREEWQNEFSPTTVYAVPYGVQYIAFDTSASGFIFSPVDPSTPLTTLDRFYNIAAIQNDSYSGDVYIVQNNQVRLWDPPQSIPYSYTWISKEFGIPKPVNFGAYRVKFASNIVQLSTTAYQDYSAYNTARMALPLDTLNYEIVNGTPEVSVINGVATNITAPPYMLPANATLPSNLCCIAGGPLYNISQYQVTQASINVTVLARDLNSVWNIQYSFDAVDERTHKLPAGFKSDVWQIQLVGNTNVYSVELAETARELATV